MRISIFSMEYMAWSSIVTLGVFSKVTLVNLCRFFFSRYAGMAVDSVAVEVNQQALAVYSGNFGWEPRMIQKGRQQKQASNDIMSRFVWRIVG